MIPASPAHGGVIAYMIALSLFNLVMAFAETLQAFFMKMMHKLLYVNQSNKWECWKFWIENPYIVGKNLYTQLVIKFNVSHAYI